MSLAPTVALHGALVVDKPPGMTSFTAMRAVQRALGVRGAGHAGTLDPMATGVLVVLIGEVTKVSALLMDHDKEYLAGITLGSETDTLDAEGEVVAHAPVPPLDEARVREVAATFVGHHPQVPPRYSALKKDGRTHMSRARAGEDFIVEARPSICHGVTVTSVASDKVELACHVGKGYYVRSLARDLAKALGTVGHLSSLRRTRVGAFTLAQAVSPENARAEHLIPLADCLPTLPRLKCSARLADDVRCGRPTTVARELVSTGSPGLALALAPDGVPLALVELQPHSGGGLRVRVTRGLNLSSPS